ncbi:MAG TPA: hypothetical protein VGM06_02615 [Polyangiaceae bacterium]
MHRYSTQTVLVLICLWLIAPSGCSSTAQVQSSCGSLSEACAIPALHCVMSWSMAQDAASWCASFPGSRVAIVTDCDGFDIAEVAGAGAASIYYYDPRSGALAGIKGEAPDGTVACVGGAPPGGSLTDCSDAGTPPFACNIDGGVQE